MRGATVSPPHGIYSGVAQGRQGQIQPGGSAVSLTMRRLSKRICATCVTRTRRRVGGIWMQGKFATNLWRIPSLKSNSAETVRAGKNGRARQDSNSLSPSGPCYPRSFQTRPYENCAGRSPLLVGHSGDRSHAVYTHIQLNNLRDAPMGIIGTVVGVFAVNTNSAVMACGFHCFDFAKR